MLPEIFLTDGASAGVKMLMTALIRSENGTVTPTTAISASLTTCPLRAGMSVSVLKMTAPEWACRYSK